MKQLLVGAAAGALLMPDAAFAGDGHDHACVDDACTVFELFQSPAPQGGVTGWQGTEAPRYGTWGFDMSGRDTSVSPGDSFFRHANGAAFRQQPFALVLEPGQRDDQIAARQVNL